MNKIRRFGFLVTIRNFRRTPVVNQQGIKWRATLVIPEVDTVCTSVLLGRYFGIHATVYGSAYSPFSAHQARYHSQSMPSTQKRGSKAQSAHGISP